MIGIVNYGAGNIFSLTSALSRLGIGYGMINEPKDFEDFSHIIIPGVGHAGATMQKLQESGLSETIKALKKPVLGICVGMQLLTAFSEEGSAEMLKIVPMQTKLFGSDLALKVPHMGWNNVLLADNRLFIGIPQQTQFYFVHSYFIEYNKAYTIAEGNYGVKFSAGLQSDNFYGVQFHPEKSGQWGEQLLVNFNEI